MMSQQGSEHLNLQWPSRSSTLDVWKRFLAAFIFTYHDRLEGLSLPERRNVGRLVDRLKEDLPSHDSGDGLPPEYAQDATFGTLLVELAFLGAMVKENTDELVEAGLFAAGTFLLQRENASEAAVDSASVLAQVLCVMEEEEGEWARRAATTLLTVSPKTETPKTATPEGVVSLESRRQPRGEPELITDHLRAVLNQAIDLALVNNLEGVDLLTDGEDSLMAIHHSVLEELNERKPLKRGTGTWGASCGPIPEAPHVLDDVHLGHPVTFVFRVDGDDLHVECKPTNGTGRLQLEGVLTLERSKSFEVSRELYFDRIQFLGIWKDALVGGSKTELYITWSSAL